MSVAGRAAHTAATLPAVALLLIIAPGCSSSPERSTVAFCDTLASRSEELRERYEPGFEAAEAADDPIAGLLLGVQALGDLSGIIQELADRAPEQIQTDMDRINETFKRSSNIEGLDAESLLTQLAQNLVDGLLIVGAIERVDAFAERECGQPIFAG